MKIRFFCEDCGVEAMPDKARITPNWESIPPKCVRCGGKYKVQVS